MYLTCLLLHDNSNAFCDTFGLRKYRKRHCYSHVSPFSLKHFDQFKEDGCGDFAPEMTLFPTRIKHFLLLHSWRFFRYSAHIHWLVHGHMTSNNETVSCKMPRPGNIAKTMTSNRKQFTATREMLTAVARHLSITWLFVFHRFADQFALLYNKSLTTVFVDTRLWKTKHPWKRFQNFRQSYVLLTDRNEINRSQPLAWPFNFLYVMLAGCDWWISIRHVDNT